MERLTKTYSDGTHGASDSLPCGENSYNYKNLLIEKLGKYEDLEEQGRLVILPCKVGDTIYGLHKAMVCELDTETIGISKMPSGEILYLIDGWELDKGDFGKTVFLTKSEAEAKLKELRGGENDRISKN